MTISTLYNDLLSSSVLSWLKYAGTPCPPPFRFIRERCIGLLKCGELLEWSLNFVR